MFCRISKIRLASRFSPFLHRDFRLPGLFIRGNYLTSRRVKTCQEYNPFVDAYPNIVCGGMSINVVALFTGDPVFFLTHTQNHPDRSWVNILYTVFTHPPTQPSTVHNSPWWGYRSWIRNHLISGVQTLDQNWSNMGVFISGGTCKSWFFFSDCPF